MTNPKLELHLFGGMEINFDQQRVTKLASRKAHALVTYLVCNPYVYPRDVLADLLWDERTQRQAMGNLRVILNSMRNELSPFVMITRQTVQIDRSEELWADTVRFEELVAPLTQGTLAMPLPSHLVTDLQGALQLYKGEFLAGFYLRDAQQFEEWAVFERERYHILAVKTARALTHHYVAMQEYGSGVAAAQRWIQLDPLGEEAHRLLMELLLGDGQRTAALDHYQAYINRLAQEQMEPSLELNLLYQQITRDELSAQIHSLQISEPEMAFVPSAANRRMIPNNLPSALTPIIGRDEEIAQIQSRLENSSCRLLTIVGLGGVGKTRLAVETAQLLTTSAAAQRLFGDGIYLIRLERIEAKQLLPSIIASAIHYTFQGTLDPTKQLLQYLRNRRILLIFDNFEHLISESDLIDELLQHAPHLKILLTSRQRLEFLGEWLFPIQGLPYPALLQRGENGRWETDVLPQSKATAEIPWYAYPATQLFIHTVQTLRPMFEPEADKEFIIKICHILEGLPLGIQLAAAAVHTHSCLEIATAIQQNLAFINTTMRNLPERHRSLRAAFDHSWQLLSDEEQAAFRNLAVFVDGFSEESAIAVNDISQAMLIRLINRSLVQQMEGHYDQNPQHRYRRYRLHPVLHQYANQQLAAALANEEERRQRHCLYFAHFAAEHEAELSTARAGDTARLLVLELENIRAAWRYALTQRWSDPLHSMLPVLMRFYLLRGFLLDAIALLDSAIAAIEQWITSAGNAKTLWQPLLVLLFTHKAEILTEQGHYEQAWQTGQIAIEHARKSKDLLGEARGYLQWGIALNGQGAYEQAIEKLTHALRLARNGDLLAIEATAHRHLGVSSFYQGDYVAGRTYYETAIQQYQMLGDLLSELRTYLSLGMLYIYNGGYFQARQYYERCLQAYQEIGDRATMAVALNNLGAVSTHLGDYQNATQFFQEALTIHRSIGDRQTEGLILANLGLVAHLINNHPTALDHCLRALDVSLEIGERDTEAYTRTCLGHVLLELGRASEAVVNYEQAIAVRKSTGQEPQMLEPLAGLARTYLRLRKPHDALSYVEEILPHLQVGTYAGIVELIRIYLTCYRVLYLLEDPRANDVLTMGHTILRERAERITDTRLSQCYLENIIAHRELLTEYEIRNDQ